MPFKRRKYFIEKRTQSRFIMRFVMIALLGGVAAVLMFNFLAVRKIDVLLYSMRLPEGPTSNILWREMLYSCLAAIMVTFLILTVAARRLFARIHGPLKKLAAEIRRIREGDLSRKVELRRDDEFQGFAEGLNILTEELHRRFSAIKKNTDELIRTCESDEGTEKQVAEQLAALEKDIRIFKI